MLLARRGRFFRGFASQVLSAIAPARDIENLEFPIAGVCDQACLPAPGDPVPFSGHYEFPGNAALGESPLFATKQPEFSATALASPASAVVPFQR